MSIDEYLQKSSRLIAYAQSIQKNDPERAVQIAKKQLEQHTILLQRFVDQQEPNQQNPQHKNA